MKRLEFTDKQKALIYERDKWLCAFSWKILWILHYGASQLFDEDWVDHIKPAMKGWDNSVDNWVCASSFFNSKKRDNSHDNKFLFLKWEPTKYYYHSYWFINDEISSYTKQVYNIHSSDWFINRAFSKLLIAVDRIYEPFDLKWKIMVRDEYYWCWAAYKKIIQWKKITNKNNILDFKDRLNIDYSKLWNDQKIMLEIINSNNIDDVVKIANQLVPYYKNSILFFDRINNIYILEDIIKFKKEVQNEKLLSLRDKAVLLNALNSKIIDE